MKTLSCHLFEPPAYIIVRRRSSDEKFSFVKNFTNEKIYSKRFQKKPLSQKFCSTWNTKKGEMKMKTLSVTFESFTNENAMEIYKRNEKVFITIENLSNVKTFTNVNEKIVSIENNFHWDYDDEMETFSLQKKEFTFVYEITSESVSKCKIFLDLLLEMDMEFTYVI